MKSDMEPFGTTQGEQETRICQNCKKDFILEPEDFAFYEKIKVPSPTFCPECRAIRRMSWRNERTLYKRKCDATGKDIITMFAPDTPVIVYDRDYWWSDGWDQLASGRDYDFSKPFLVQFRALLEKAPLPNLANSNTVNSPYGNHNAEVKNCYLIYASFQAEDCSYGYGAVHVKDSMDFYVVAESERVYDSLLCGTVNNVRFSHNADDSVNGDFLFFCKNLIDCLGCVNLRNKSNCIFNRQYSKEAYKKERARYDFGSYTTLENFRKQFEEFSLKFPRRFAYILKSVDVTGDEIMNTKNTKMGFDLYGNIEDCKYVAHAWGPFRDSYDSYGAGANAQLLYENIDTGIDAARNLFTVFTHHCNDVQYVYACQSSDHLFGCVGLNKKKYCILNKQYTKEEYEALFAKIIAHTNQMPYVEQRANGEGQIEYRYGEFFPPELSPFDYNESMAQEYYPLTPNMAAKKGFRWRAEEEKTHAVTIMAGDLPDHIKDVKDDILQAVIGCAHGGKCNEKCTRAFKLIPQELSLYRQYNLALPRLCPNCRHFHRLAQRNPMRLWHRACQCAGPRSSNGVYENQGSHSHGNGPCQSEFETPYAPERSEIVYCESCYQSEII